ncbi:LOW QUALITY PROTEIN: ankyrin repeat domain-containing protein 50 [Clupea harengus]|uniref:LOW QUALITY PROTEIN: ankyrin repeat domain-containing protein 50 n=1 Tax=Clupea harengus TaxID=7950 RepID=A0A8M1KW34_CLUHA|nr:LOW QUALITY PROTEIN: ankyrin repeat domain-containing protein 50 [Clupea harengus]
MRNSLNSSSYLTMAQTSLLQGKRFYCREWVFHKIQHCLQEKTNGLGNVTSTPSKQAVPPPVAPPTQAAPSAALQLAREGGVLGYCWWGPGSGKTALCTELLWPSSAQGLHRGLHQAEGLAYPLSAGLGGTDSDTLCVSGFIRRPWWPRSCPAGPGPGYEEKVRDPAVQSALQPGECERNPTEAFKRCVLLPLLSAKPPPQALFLLVDSIDEGASWGEGEQRSPSGSPRTIAELLASHHEFLPPWLLLVCSARRQNKAITKLFTGTVCPNHQSRTHLRPKCLRLSQSIALRRPLKPGYGRMVRGWRRLTGQSLCINLSQPRPYLDLFQVVQTQV